MIELVQTNGEANSLIIGPLYKEFEMMTVTQLKKGTIICIECEKKDKNLRWDKLFCESTSKETKHHRNTSSDSFCIKLPASQRISYPKTVENTSASDTSSQNHAFSAVTGNKKQFNSATVPKGHQITQYQSNLERREDLRAPNTVVHKYVTSDGSQANLTSPGIVFEEKTMHNVPGFKGVKSSDDHSGSSLMGLPNPQESRESKMSSLRQTLSAINQDIKISKKQIVQQKGIHLEKFVAYPEGENKEKWFNSQTSAQLDSSANQRSQKSLNGGLLNFQVPSPSNPQKSPNSANLSSTKAYQTATSESRVTLDQMKQGVYEHRDQSVLVKQNQTYLSYSPPPETRSPARSPKSTKPLVQQAKPEPRHPVLNEPELPQREQTRVTDVWAEQDSQLEQEDRLAEPSIQTVRIATISELIGGETTPDFITQLASYNQMLLSEDKILMQRTMIQLLTQKLRREESLRFKQERESEILLLKDAMELDSLVDLCNSRNSS